MKIQTHVAGKFDLKEFEGKTGEINRSLWRKYKALLLDDESTVKFFKKEFEIVGDYLEYLGEEGLAGAIDSDSETLADIVKHLYPDYKLKVSECERCEVVFTITKKGGKK